MADTRYKELLLNIALFAVNSVATKLVTFLLVPLYTYFMTAEEYGITDMSLTVISLVTPLATLSVADATVRFIVGDRGKGPEYAFIGFAVTVLSILLVAILTPLLDLAVFGGLGAYKGWFVLAYASSALLQLCGEVARGAGEIRLIPICAGISSLITCFAAVVLIGGLRMAAIGYFASVSVGPLVAVAAYFAVGGLGKLVLDGARSAFLNSGRRERLKTLVVPMMRYSLPLIPNSLFWWVGTSINRFFITGMLGIAASGMFAAAGKLPNLLNTAYSVFQQAWQLSAFQESKEEGLDRFFSSVFRILQASMTVLCALISFLAPWLASIFLQGEFYGAWPMISILLIANLMNVFNAFYGTVYTTTMHTSYIMRTTVVGAIACVALTPALIIPLGTYGACTASALGNALVLAMRARNSRKYIRFDVGWHILAPSLILLVVQSAVTATQISGWQAISGACLTACIALQGARLLPQIKDVVFKMHISRKNKAANRRNRIDREE